MLGHKSLSGHQPIMAGYWLKIVCLDIFSASLTKLSMKFIDCVRIFKSFESGPLINRTSLSLVQHFRSLSHPSARLTV